MLGATILILLALMFGVVAIAGLWWSIGTIFSEDDYDLFDTTVFNVFARIVCFLGSLLCLITGCLLVSFSFPIL